MKIQEIGTQYPKVKMLDVNGLTCAQSSKVRLLLNEIKTKDDIELIIEVGTCRGGFSLLLRKYFPDAEIHTIDNEEWHPIEEKRQEFEKHNINYITDNCFSSYQLNNVLTDNRKKVVFCDGGNKANEFNTFKNSINPNDIIGVHDYFEKQSGISNDIWTTCETTKDMLDLKNMEECNYRHSKLAVWGMFKKTKNS
jgi:hypothetical protein